MDADERLNRLVLHMFRNDHGDENLIGGADHADHLRDCPDAQAVDATGEDGPYGCDTGCEYVTLEAVIRCPHGREARFAYSTFGDMAGLFDDMEDRKSVV